eukprot:tig00021571_g22365.t1
MVLAAVAAVAMVAIVIIAMMQRASRAKVAGGASSASTSRDSQRASRRRGADPADSADSALLGLPDALLLRIVRLACASSSEDLSSRGPFCCDPLEAKLRAICIDVAASPEPNASASESPAAGPAAGADGEPWVELKQLCRLRGVCRRLADLVDAGGAAPRARLQLFFGADPKGAAVEAALERACEGAARVAGIEELDLFMDVYDDKRYAAGAYRGLPAFSLAPLARFGASLRALRVDAPVFLHAHAMEPRHVAPLAALPGLACLDFRGVAIKHAALADLSPLPLAALRVGLCCGAPADAKAALAALVASFPRLERLLLQVRLFASAEATALGYGLRYASKLSLLPIGSLSNLRCLSVDVLGSLEILSLDFLPPLARLEHLRLRLDRGLDPRPLASLPALQSLDLDLVGDPEEEVPRDLSFLAPLARLGALELYAYAPLDPRQLLPLAPRLRCLRLQAEHLEGRPAAALADALLRFTALQDLKLEVHWDCAEALAAGRSLAAWRRVRTLDLDVNGGRRAIRAPFLARVASDMKGLRELALAGKPELPLPLAPDVAAALRRRLRRLRLDMPSTQRGQRAELEKALGIRVEPYSP